MLLRNPINVGSPFALEDRMVVITGAGRRADIGYAVGGRLLDLGPSVVAHGLRAARTVARRP
jgi:NAD(P)-dependent dehydrogenase (short-subunit alcohol dehydrogenase family)